MSFAICKPSVLQVGCPEERKVVLVCTSLLYSSQVGFIQQWLLVKPTPTPIFFSLLDNKPEIHQVQCISGPLQARTQSLEATVYTRII